MTDSHDSLPYRPEVPDVVEPPAPAPVVESKPGSEPRRNRIAVVGLVFAVLALAIFMVPFLYLPFDHSGWLGLISAVLGLFLWPFAGIAGIVGWVLSSRGVWRSHLHGRRRLAIVGVALAAVATVLSFGLELLLLMALSGVFYRTDY